MESPKVIHLTLLEMAQLTLPEAGDEDAIEATLIIGMDRFDYAALKLAETKGLDLSQPFEVRQHHSPPGYIVFNVPEDPTVCR